MAIDLNVESVLSQSLQGLVSLVSCCTVLRAAAATSWAAWVGGGRQALPVTRRCHRQPCGMCAVMNARHCMRYDEGCTWARLWEQTMLERWQRSGFAPS